MAFRFGDPGSRLYNVIGASAVNLLGWWNGPNSNVAAAFSVTASGGRSGTNALRLRAGSLCYVSKVLDNQQTWGIAFGVKVIALASGGNWGAIFTLIDGSTGSVQTELRLGADGSLRVFHGNGVNSGTTNIIATTTAVLGVSTWYHVEWLTKIHGSTGTVQIWINGILVMNLTGQNTQVSANSTASIVYVGCLNADVSVTVDLDDIIIYDGQTTDPQGNPDIVGPIGDCGLAWSLPNGDGTTTQFSRDSGTNNYLRVNEATPDGDTSYTFDATVNHIDTYAMANLPAAATGVKSLMAVSYMRKDDVGTRVCAPVIRTNTANFVGTNVSLPNSYIYAFNSWGQNPSGTPATWTVADVNAIEGGQKVIS